MHIIQIQNIEGTGFHSIEYQEGRTKCWQEDYIEIPEFLVPQVIECGGHCDLAIQDGVLVNIIPVPHPPRPVPEPTELELAQQDITDLQLGAIEQGQAMTDLELMLLGVELHV